MPVRRIVANEKVAADRDRVALQRGPIVYAAEWPDNPNGKVRNIVLPDTSTLTAEFQADLLNGVEVIKGRAFGLSYDAAARCKRPNSRSSRSPTRRGRIAAAGRWRCGSRKTDAVGEADALSDGRHDVDAHPLGEHEEHPQHHRRRDSGRLE